MARDRDRDYDEDYDEEYDDDYGDEYSDDRKGRGGPPPNYLVPSILVTLCCCLVGGIIAIVNAAQVNSKWSAGDYAGARKASANAKMWCWLSFGIGIFTNILYLILNFAVLQGGAK